jgi:hypothetical protein
VGACSGGRVLARGRWRCGCGAPCMRRGCDTKTKQTRGHRLLPFALPAGRRRAAGQVRRLLFARLGRFVHCPASQQRVRAQAVMNGSLHVRRLMFPIISSSMCVG